MKINFRRKWYIRPVEKVKGSKKKYDRTTERKKVKEEISRYLGEVK